MKKSILDKIDLCVDHNIVNEAGDDENPKHMFQGMDTKLVIKVATGKIKAEEYAKFEMQNRGFGKKGEWIGFLAAEKLWKSKVK